jgi:MoaA/NifB/PqqE/SkfB family radical SAM enzyme
MVGETGTTKMKDKLILDGHKLAWHRDRVEAWLAGERVAPITIDLALTRRCTMRCIYCYGQLQENDEKRITRDVIYRFLDDAAEIGVKAISLISDGESTCSPYFYDTIIRAKEYGLDIGVATNGVLLEDPRLHEILPKLTYLRFNMSAEDPTRYAEIHGCKPDVWYKVTNTIRKAVAHKRLNNLPVTIGIQMVLMPEFGDQIIPLAKLGKTMGVDYFVIKHCSDDELHTLGVDYTDYLGMVDLLATAESYSNPTYLVKAKWQKLMDNKERTYSKCYGPIFMPQFSGSGLVAPCGMLFNDRYKNNFHIGNLVDFSFKQMWKSEGYWATMDRLASPAFNAKYDCGCMCLQHLCNMYLDGLVKGERTLEDPVGDPPAHVNFI